MLSLPRPARGRRLFLAYLRGIETKFGYDVILISQDLFLAYLRGIET